jgi:hypothetical protein
VHGTVEDDALTVRLLPTGEAARVEDGRERDGTAAE